MFGRPRCREWTPLATQQLRLRSLIQIVGYNIRPPEWSRTQCSYYLTLHHTTMSAPFYTSERICSPHPKWKEIDSEITQRMSSTNLVVRVWSHTLQSNDENVPQDTVIQTWGVYLSGLRYIGANLASYFTSDCFKSNTLVFQLHGGYFCSYKSLKLDIIPPENEDQGSFSSDSSGRTNLSKITLEPKHLLSHKLAKECRSLSPSKYGKRLEKEYSKSHSPNERGFHQNFPTIRPSASLNINNAREDRENCQKEDPSSIYEHSPDKLDVKEFTTCEENCDSLSKNASKELSTSKIDLSETAESYDLRSEVGVPKYRYLAMSFLKSEIRPSYNATKLQKLHLLQYSIKKRKEAVQEIKERIYKNNSLTNWAQGDEKCEDKLKFRSRSQRNLFSPEDENLAKGKSSSQSDLSAKNGRVKEGKPVSNGPRLTLKLNDLLSFKAKPSPYQRAEHIRLTKQLEILRFKRIILLDERDSKLASIRRLKERHAKLSEENQDVGSELMQSFHTLSRETEAMKTTIQSCSALRELAARSHATLASRRASLLQQLHQIFYIQQIDSHKWSICDVPLSVCGDSARPAAPLVESIAAGLAAQAVCLAADILAQPLRYKITLLGSASKILDVTPDLPDPNIPLYARAGDVTLFRYAMFLLNKCVAQLCAGRGAAPPDIRPTLANLQALLTAGTHLSDTCKLFGTHRDGQCGKSQSLRSLVASERGKLRQFNRFKDAVDGVSPQLAMDMKRHRQSRSVGSYHDDQELATLVASTTSIMGSESNIYNIKLTQVDSTEMSQLKSHSSESEISRLAERSFVGNPQPVVFTIGDDTAHIQSKLVRISSNNDDEITCASCMDENVTRICQEINNFCLSNREISSKKFRSPTPAQSPTEFAPNSEHGPSTGFPTPNFYESSNSDCREIHEGFDIVRHLDIAKQLERRAREIDNTDQCANCESNKDGVCDLVCAKSVTDVIVIPSAEAVLDTGQVEIVDIDKLT